MSDVVKRAIEIIEDQNPAEDWQPIEIAPKDGAPIVAFHPYDWASPHHRPSYAIIRWYEDQGKWIFALPGNYMQHCGVPPTHWMPLPDPPPDLLAILDEQERDPG